MANVLAIRKSPGDCEVPRPAAAGLPMTCPVVIQRGFFVAQVSNLLCRRLPRRQAPGWIHNACRLGNPRHSRLGSLRYGVLQRIMLRCSSSPHQEQRLGVIKPLGMTTQAVQLRRTVIFPCPVLAPRSSCNSGDRSVQDRPGKRGRDDRRTWRTTLRSESS